MFNDVELPVGEVYATASSAYLPIPRQIPLEVNNKLYYETELGSTTYDFTVSVPLVQVDGLYNEFALPLWVRRREFHFYCQNEWCRA